MRPKLTLAQIDAARKAQLYTPTVIEELQTLEQDLGGRQALVGLLILAPLTPDLRYIVGLLGDPTHQKKSFAEICTMGNLLPGKILELLSAAALLRGKVLASQRIGLGIAKVADDVMRRAAPYEDRCTGPCQGTGYITWDPSPAHPNPAPEKCPVCDGMGVLTFTPDLERQKLAIEMAHLLPKSGGIQIAQINHPGGGGGSAGLGTLEKLQQVTDKILYGSGADIVEGEAEVVDEDPPDAG